MRSLWTIYWICGLQFTQIARAADILFVHTVASYSHVVTIWPLAEALADRGHNVTYISPCFSKQPNPKILEFVPKQLAQYVEASRGKNYDVNFRIEKKLEPMFDMIWDIEYDACKSLYSSPDFQNWLSVNKKFDLVIIDSCFAHNCGVGLAYKLQAKYIYFSTVVLNGFEYDALGVPAATSAIPVLDIYSQSTPMGFFARLTNTVGSLQWRLKHYLKSFEMDGMIRNALKLPEMPYIGDLVSKPGLIFYTGDVITDYPRALPPNFVNIAGIHCKESENVLPEDILSFLGNNQTGISGTDGFVYISLGTFVLSSDLPFRIKQVFFETIKSFPNLKFLWKWSGDFPKEIPENLLLRKWFPQVDVLAHPNILAFVTQNGRPSTMEAVFHGVPQISFPIIGDQDYNANRVSEVGASIKLEIGTVTAKELKDAIRKTVYDPSVKARMKKFQRVFRDRPMSPIETAVWWTEYVLRTEDTLHLRAAGADQSWFVRRQIDVWAFLSIGLFMITLVALFGIAKLVSKLTISKQKLKTR